MTSRTVDGAANKARAARLVDWRLSETVHVDRSNDVSYWQFAVVLHFRCETGFQGKAPSASRVDDAVGAWCTTARKLNGEFASLVPFFGHRDSRQYIVI